MSRVAWLIAGAVFASDLAIKTLLGVHPGLSTPVIQNIFHITVVFNTGAAFGLLRGQTTFLIAIGLAFMLFFFFVLTKERKTILSAVASGLVAGGALSNLYDRIVRGYVVDYLVFRIWPVFNLSDTCISIGVGLLILETYRKTRVTQKELR